MNKRQAVIYKEGLLSRYKYEVGDFVSTDQFLYRHPDVCLMVMAVSGARIVSMAALSTMMPLPA